MQDRIQAIYRFGHFTLNPSKHALCADEVEIPLAPKTFQVLLCLVRNPGRVVTKEEMLTTIWSGSFIDESNLSQQIFRLRKAMVLDGEGDSYIRTIPGVGYQFTAEVQMEETQALMVQEDPAIRPEVASGLYRERTRTVVEEVAHASWQPRRLMGWIALLVLLLIGGGLMIWRYTRPVAVHHEVVVADFDNQTGDPNFNFVLKTALTIDLQQSPDFAVLPNSEAAATLKRMLRPANQQLTGATALEVCQRNNEQTLLSGTIARLEKSYLLTLEATDCRMGKSFAAVKGQAQGKDAIVETLGRIDSEMRHRLGESLQSVANFDVPLASATTSSLDALITYSQGMQAPSFSAGIPYFERALQLDPAFAMAWERLGVANGEMGNLAVQNEAFTKAYQNRAGATAREEFWITSHYNEIVLDNHEGARRNYELFVKSYPFDDIAWGSLADTLRQMGRYPESLDAALHSNALVKHGIFAQLELAKAYQANGQFERARAVCRDGIAARPNDSAMHQILQVNDFALKDDAAYAAELAWSKGNDREFQLLALNAEALATQGRMQDAKKEFERSRDVARAHDVTNFPFIDDAEEALADTLGGSSAQAGIIAARVPYSMHDVSAMAGLAAALSGNSVYVNKLIDALLADSTEPSSMSRQYFVPVLRAATAIHAGDGLRARQLLDPARIYTMREYWVWFLTGQSYLLTGQPQQAAEQFKAIVANPGIDPISPMYPLAHLGLARAYALEKRVDDSRTEYQMFFASFDHADQTLPVLAAARREYGLLGKSQ